MNGGVDEMRQLFGRFPFPFSGGTRAGKSINERVILFQAALIGRDMAFNILPSRRSCDIVQVWMTVHAKECHYFK